MIRLFSFIIFLFVTLGLTVVTSVQLEKAKLYRRKLLDAPPLADLSPTMLKVVTLGYKGVFDDFADIWMLQILASPDLKREDPDAVFKVLHSVTQHHPKIEDLYMLGCFVLGLDFHRADLCQTISLEGLQAFPHSWRIPMTQGYMHAFVLNEPAQAAVFFRLAASRPQSPAYVAHVAERMAASEEMTQEDAFKAFQILTDIPGGSGLTEFLVKHNTKLPRVKAINKSASFVKEVMPLRKIGAPLPPLPTPSPSPNYEP